ncbi:hypothetical protein HPP92_024861 [Vanilla planifolia]|uniref:Uncharacterized protein n=1 Tax=Vanilla planifolia TaxID=51239 RepID=A0A835PHV6_VANPL|nr:hypothetical protein HPP92_025125 [Vanilla planifolia]KAG0453557.1 hypothetical protein HPP92_024861 [Vanilla planifolia]
MEEQNPVSKSLQELRDLYAGIPDDSVDLTFKYLTVRDKKAAGAEPSEGQAERNSEAVNGSKEHDHGRERSPRQSCMGSRKGSRVMDEGRLTATGRPSGSLAAGQGQRKVVPHTNLCALCGVRVRLFSHRCLVCGRIYCNNCLSKGMGKMTEGRKCLECLGRRFNQRYISKAGKCGCCYGYSSEVKRQELIWAEKGARKSGGQA